MSAHGGSKHTETALRGDDITHGAIIGRGGSGVVREGTLRRAGGVAPVAIKMLGAGATEKDVARFEKELRVSLRASERCPRACHIYGSVFHEGALCLVMKLYTRSLHAYLDDRRSPDGTNWITPLAHEEVVALATQILEGLVQLHAQGIVVQDLKPGNILMDEDGQIAISDFGLAAMLSSTLVTAQSSSLAGGGTPAYKAPEQYDEDSFGTISTTTDMWSFGCVVVELLTGFAPWKGKQPMQIMMSVAGKRQAPPIPEEATGALTEVLRGCFSHVQQARPTADQALLALLGRAALPAPSTGDARALGEVPAVSAPIPVASEPEPESEVEPKPKPRTITELAAAIGEDALSLLALSVADMTTLIDTEHPGCVSVIGKSKIIAELESHHTAREAQQQRVQQAIREKAAREQAAREAQRLREQERARREERRRRFEAREQEKRRQQEAREAQRQREQEERRRIEERQQARALRQEERRAWLACEPMPAPYVGPRDDSD